MIRIPQEIAKSVKVPKKLSAVLTIDNGAAALRLAPQKWVPDVEVIWASDEPHAVHSITQADIARAKLGEPISPDPHDGVREIPDPKMVGGNFVLHDIGDRLRLCAEYLDESGRFGSVAVTAGGDLVATDGKRLIVCGDGGGADEVVCLIHARAIEQALKLAKKRTRIDLCVSAPSVDLMVRSGDGVIVRARPHEVRFPAIRDVINFMGERVTIEIPAPAEIRKAAALAKIDDVIPRWSIGALDVDMRFALHLPDGASEALVRGEYGPVRIDGTCGGARAIAVMMPMSRE